MSWYYKVLIALGVIGLSIASVLYYGYTKYEAGIQYEIGVVNEQTRKDNDKAKEEVDAAKLKDAADKLKQDQRVKDAEVSNTKLASANKRLQQSIASLKASSTNKGQPVLNGSGEIGLDLLGECSNSYSDMAKEAGRLADKVTALQEHEQTTEELFKDYK